MATQKIYTPDEARKRYDSLPKEVQDMLYSFEMLSTLKELGQKYGLHIDQVGILQAQTSAVMMGFTEPQDFPAELAENLHIEQTKADSIAKDINDQLFVKIRESMKRSDAAAMPAPQPSAPQSAPAPIPPPAPKPIVPAPKPNLSPADMMLQNKTVSTPSPAAPTPPPTTTVPPPAAPAAKPEPPKPGAYSADPYREPPL